MAARPGPRARGTHATHTAFESLWEQAVRRSAHHYGCHVAALRHLSAAWYGSHRECFDFAEQAAADALPDSLVQALPVRAAFDLLLDTPGGRPTTSVLEERIDAAADLAIKLSAAYRPGLIRGRPRSATSSRTSCSPGAAGRRHCTSST